MPAFLSVIEIELDLDQFMGIERPPRLLDHLRSDLPSSDANDRGQRMPERLEETFVTRLHQRLRLPSEESVGLCVAGGLLAFEPASAGGVCGFGGAFRTTAAGGRRFA